jgi:hypothetical protein
MKSRLAGRSNFIPSRLRAAFSLSKRPVDNRTTVS